MRTHHSLASLLAVGLLVGGAALPAGARTVALADPQGDVVGAESGTAIAEPRADIEQVVVDHEARRLALEVSVGRAVAFDDPAWVEGHLLVNAVLAEPTSEDEPVGDVWLWEVAADGAGGVGANLYELSGDFGVCPTDATVDPDAGTYTLTAGPACLVGVPRTLQVGVLALFDPEPIDDDFDVALDEAPDGDLSEPIGSSGAPAVTRIAGTDRIGTAIALSRDRFADGAAPAAVLASGDDFPDAVAGGPLAAVVGGPLLLTSGTDLDERVAAELQRAVGVGGTVHVLGGTAAIAEDTATAVRALGLMVDRVAGADRFATAVAVAERVSPSIVLIADGRGFADAIIAGAAAASLGGAVVLADGNLLPPATDAYLAGAPVRHLAVGAAAVAAPGAERLVAPSTAELSRLVLRRLVPGASSLAVASADAFADGLAGAPHAAALGGGILLTDGAQLSAPVAAELGLRASELREVVVYGGTAAVSAATLAAVIDAVS